MPGGTLLTAPYISHWDGNQVPSMMGVEGTLGTADLAGTARPLPISVDPLTGALYTANSGVGTNIVSDAAYDVQVDDSSSGGTLTYVGEANPGVSGTAESWRIKRIVDTAGTQTVITWADGNSNFDNIWTDRGTYNYS